MFKGWYKKYTFNQDYLKQSLTGIVDVTVVECVIVMWSLINADQYTTQLFATKTKRNCFCMQAQNQ